MNSPRPLGIDGLQAQTTLQEAAALCGIPLDVQGGGRQQRIDCPFGCGGEHAGLREISVDTGNPQKVFCCHAYGCQLRGNLATLMHGWLTGSRPTGDKLKGDEFRRVREVLAGTAPPPLPAASRATPAPAAPPAKSPSRNLPLADSDNPKTRELTTLDERFLRDVTAMPPAAANYIRRHPCLSPAAMQKWRVGVLPQENGSDKRGWSLRGQLLYPVLAEDGQLLAWVARDPQFESKEQAFLALPPEQRAKETKPAKHRFPVGFQRGLELFGQHAARLKEPGYREAIARHGIIVVEGFNDVIALDSLDIPAVAILSNKITDEQATKIDRWSRSLAGGHVRLLFDADDAGDNGAKEALWLLAQRGLDVRLGWSRTMHGGAYANRQPESLTQADLSALLGA
jgi:5S rRNA maturation endonuclease (ribonuclease M5)